MHGPTAAAIPAGLAPEFDHRGDRRLQHARDRAPPAGMGGADHPGLPVGEQHRRAIGGDDPQRHPRAGR